MRIKSILRQMSHNLPRELYRQTNKPRPTDAKILDALIAGDAGPMTPRPGAHAGGGALVLTILEKRNVLSD